MISRLYNWTLSLAQSPQALWALAVISFIESSFFPIPPDIIIIPMIIAAPRRAFLIASIATSASVLGGLFGYFIGAVFFETVGQPIFDFYGKSNSVAEFSEKFNAYGAWAVLVAGITPFPFKVVTIMSGVTSLSLPVFIVSAIIARALIADTIKTGKDNDVTPDIIVTTLKGNGVIPATRTAQAP